MYIFLCIIGNASRSLELTLDTTVEPNSESNKKDANDNLYNKLIQPSVQKELSLNLSEELGTEVEVGNVKTGSILLQLILKEYSELEYVKSLSDCGVLSNIFGNLLVTPEYLESCKADKVYVDAKVIERSYLELMEHARGELFCQTQLKSSMHQ